MRKKRSLPNAQANAQTNAQANAQAIVTANKYNINFTR